MAKAPSKTTANPVPSTPAAAAGAQPWATGTETAAAPPVTPEDSASDATGGNGGGDTQTPATESPPAEQNTPEQAAASAPEDETPSEVTDQVTPAGENPSETVSREVEAVTDGKAHTPAAVKAALADAPEGETPAEAVDQVTPIGTDIALARFLGAKESGDPTEAKEAAQELFRSLSEDDRTAINQHLDAEALKIIEKVAKGNKAKREAARMIDGTRHYGNLARRPAPTE